MKWVIGAALLFGVAAFAQYRTFESYQQQVQQSFGGNNKQNQCPVGASCQTDYDCNSGYCNLSCVPVDRAGQDRRCVMN